MPSNYSSSMPERVHNCNEDPERPFSIPQAAAEAMYE